MGGFSNAPRCPAFLTFRDSPALLRQESDGYPVRPVASYPIADRPFLTRDLPRQLIFWDAKRAVLVRSVREQSRVACASEEP